MAQFSKTNPNPVLSVGEDGTILYSNSASEPLMHEWDTAVGQKLPPHFVDVVKGANSNKTPQKMEVKAGNSIYLVTFYPLPQEECVNIYGIDISDFKCYEAKQESEEKYRSIIEISNEDLVVIDAELKITDISKKLTDKAGYSQEEVIGRLWLDFVDESSKAVAEFHMDKRRLGIGESYELKLIRKDGSPY